MKQLLLLICLLVSFSISAQQNHNGFGNADAEFRLHPNPVRDGIVYVESDHSGPKHIRIYDLFGKVVLERRLKSRKLILTSLVPGVYMVQLRQEERIATKKLVIR
ncbi:T9SS type A sorting domain-containing protein [Robiginitalea aurantiaca]|uniref:T9SS type A sorting domain-containing protein n=1 Tax=Robiginitalea aurantiaca TaxID=3056915 RepID=A0ABT7WEP2_9FLAO|nr:T9SS type A sorting domain-containing protein [Robiginitalea aurantiaca]MDM9631385.1 T9SS type A sorting domain-containing protein [Robiginitalea aurantiaca]